MVKAQQRFGDRKGEIGWVQTPALPLLYGPLQQREVRLGVDCRAGGPDTGPAGPYRTASCDCWEAKSAKGVHGTWPSQGLPLPSISSGGECAQGKQHRRAGDRENSAQGFRFIAPDKRGFPKIYKPLSLFAHLNLILASAVAECFYLNE